MFRVASLVEGRISRKTFWLRFGGVWLAAIVAFAFPLVAGFGPPPSADTAASGVPAQSPGAVMTLFYILGLALVVISLTIVPIPRFHDRDKSGWYVLVILLPYIGILWIMGECGLLPGTKEENEYGLPPED